MKISLWPNPAQPFEVVLGLARYAEAAGFDGLWYADHFMPNAEDTSVPWPECWTTLSALATAVPRLRLGTLVCGNTYRHPAVLAKMAATLDHISGGRMVLGLGAGWQENEHQQYGVPFYTVAERLARLDEACAVIKTLFTQAQSDFAGAYYTLARASLNPSPCRVPYPSSSAAEAKKSPCALPRVGPTNGTFGARRKPWPIRARCSRPIAGTSAGTPRQSSAQPRHLSS